MTRPKPDDLSAADRALIDEALALINRGTTPAHVRPQPVPVAKAAGGAIDKEVAADAAAFDWAQYWAQYVADNRAQLVNILAALAARQRLTNDDYNELYASFTAESTVHPVVTITKGRPSISYRPRFQSAEALMAYAILQIASVSPRLVRCRECQDFKLVEPSVGAPSTHFCSTKHRNRWHQRELRKRTAAAKHK